MKKSTYLIAVIIAGSLILSGCSSKRDSSGLIQNPRDVLNGVEEIDKTTTDAGSTVKNKDSKPVAPIAAKPGEKATPNETKWRVVTEISATCADLLKPFRDFEKKYPNGLAREMNATKAETDAMNQAMTKAQSNKKICSEKDFNLWYTEEYLGWSRSNK